MSSFSKFTFIALLPLALGACPSAQGLKGMEKFETEIQSAGFDMVYPLTTGYQVGQLVEVRETANGTPFLRTLCTQAFDTTLLESKVLLGSYEANETDDFDLVVGLAEQLLKNAASANASFKSSNVQKVQLTIDNATHQQLPPQLLPDGTERTVNSSCKINIKTAIDADGNFTRPTHLVLGTLSTNTLRYEFEADSSDEAQLNLMVKSLFAIEPQITSSASGKKVVELTPANGARFVIGGQAIALDKAILLNEIGPDFKVAFTHDGVNDKSSAIFKLPEK